MAYDQDTANLLKENRLLRRLLAFAYAGAHLYGDDGELQDARLPCIDFKRDSAEEIERKIHERGMKALARQLEQTNY